MSWKRNWRVLELGKGFEPTTEISLSCPSCGEDAHVPFRECVDNPVIAAIGLSLVYDLPGKPIPFDVLPKAIQCRKCHKIFTHE